MEKMIKRECPDTISRNQHSAAGAALLPRGDLPDDVRNLYPEIIISRPTLFLVFPRNDLRGMF